MTRWLPLALVLLTSSCRSPSAPPSTPPASSPEPLAEETTEPEPMPMPPTRVERIDELEMDVPEAWERVEPSSAMRKAEFRLPGDGGPLELVVYRFPGGAGSVQANLDRWRGQMKGVETPMPPMRVGPLRITRLDITGTYVAQVSPGSSERHDQDDARLLTAVIEGAGDPYYLKCVGPAPLVDAWADAIEVALQTLRPVAVEDPGEHGG